MFLFFYHMQILLLLLVVCLRVRKLIIIIKMYSLNINYFYIMKKSFFADFSENSHPIHNDFPKIQLIFDYLSNFIPFPSYAPTWIDYHIQFLSATNSLVSIIIIMTHLSQSPMLFLYISYMEKILNIFSSNIVQFTWI